MTWHYQAIKHEVGTDREWIGIHEVYRNKDGNIWGISEDPERICGEDMDSIIWTLNQIIKDIDHYPILNDNEIVYAQPDFDIPTEEEIENTTYHKFDELKKS